MKYLVRILSVLLVFTFLLAACAPAAAPAGEAASGEKKYTICFAFQDLETEFWMAGHKAITETLKAKGYEVVEVNSNEDANKQLEQVKNCIAQKVDGIMVIPVDGSIALKLIAEANKAGIPIGIFNRPPQSDEGNALTVVANNEKIAEQTVSYMADEAKKLGRKVKPLIMVGDLGDPNAVGRKQGFYNVIEANPDLFETPIEVATKWNADVARDGLQAAMTANPDVDFIFTSSDFLYPTIQGVLEPLGKWKKIGEEGHVIMGGLDGDKTACSLMQADNAYVDATGVQDLYYEADTLLAEIIKAVESGNKSPDAWLDDPGFALTQGNMAEREMDMWGCKLFHEAGGAAKPAEPAPAEAKGQIGIVFGDLNNPVFTFMKEQMEAKVKELGYDPIVLDSQGSSETELANVENLISKGVKGICLLSVNADSSLQTVKKANEAGIPIVGWNRFVDTKGTATYTTQVVTDNVPGAVDAGKLAVELLKDVQDPKIVILRGLSGIDADIDRVDGFLEGIKGSPLENSVVAIQRADFARQKGYEVMSDILQAEPKIDLVYAVNDESAIGAYQAIKEAGREGIMIIGYDGSKEYVELIKEGKVTATIAQMFATLGTTAVEYVIQAAEGTLSDVDPVVYIGTEVITKDNAATYVFK